MKKYNIALVFDDEVSNLIIDYATKLYQNINSNVLLGINSNPHITIGQFNVEDSVAKLVWEKFQSLTNELPKVDFAGITILPSSAGGGWFEISVLKNRTLTKLQEELIQVIEPFGSLSNDIRDEYRPHVTLAHTITGSELVKFPFEYKVLRLKSVRTSLGIGLGTNFEKISF